MVTYSARHGHTGQAVQYLRLRMHWYLYLCVLPTCTLCMCGIRSWLSHTHTHTHFLGHLPEQELLQGDKGADLWNNKRDEVVVERKHLEVDQCLCEDRQTDRQTERQAVSDQKQHMILHVVRHLCMRRCATYAWGISMIVCIFWGCVASHAVHRIMLWCSKTCMHPVLWR